MLLRCIWREDWNELWSAKVHELVNLLSKLGYVPSFRGHREKLFKNFLDIFEILLVWPFKPHELTSRPTRLEVLVEVLLFLYEVYSEEYD